MSFRIIDNYYCKLRDRITGGGGGGITEIVSEFPLTGDGVGNPVTFAPAHQNQVHFYSFDSGWGLTDDVNMILGYNTGTHDPSGTENVGVGPYALGNAGEFLSWCTAFGHSALREISQGNSNSAFGKRALTSLGRAGATTGGNSAFGAEALSSIIEADFNSAFGQDALRALVMVNGNANAAFGAQALYTLTGGVGNLCAGTYAGRYLSSGSQNTYIGTQAGIQNPGGAAADGSILIGSNCRSDFSNVIGIGTDVTVFADDVIAIGNEANRLAVATLEAAGQTHTIKLQIGSVTYRLLATI